MLAGTRLFMQGDSAATLRSWRFRLVTLPHNFNLDYDKIAKRDLRVGLPVRPNSRTDLCCEHSWQRVRVRVRTNLCRFYLVPNEENVYALVNRSDLGFPDGSLVYGDDSDDGKFQILLQPADITPPTNWTRMATRTIRWKGCRTSAALLRRSGVPDGRIVYLPSAREDRCDTREW